jgi:hypothetical protein
VDDDIEYVDEETQFVVLEELVAQAEGDFDDTAPMGVPALRGVTCSDWPPEPPPPSDVDLAQGTETRMTPVRNAAFYPIVRRPTTSSED